MAMLRPPAPSRRHVLAGLGALGAGLTGLGTACHAAAQAVPLSHFGVDRFGTRDQWAALKAAFEAAAAERLSLVADADAHYRHDGPLTLDGVSFDGQGCTLVPLSDGPQVLRCLGANWRVANVRLLGAARERSSDDGRDGIWVGGGDDPRHTASDFVLENVVVDAVEPGRGVAAAGFMFNDAHRGRIIRPVARRSLADGIHVTNGSSALRFERPLSETTGDDGFAVVSYRRQGRVCRDIRATDGISRDSLARGFTVVGGRDVIYERPRIERSSAAGLYFYGEEAFDTYGVERCTATGPVILDCVTGRHLPDGFRNAAIIIGGREGQDMVDGTPLARGAADCLVRDPVVTGAGPACTAAISTHQFAIRPRIVGGRLSRLVSADPGFAPNGIEIGGRDVVFEGPRMTQVGGLAIVVKATASGRCRITAPRVTGSHLRPGPIDSFFYAEAAPALDRIEMTGGTFARGPGRLAISLLPAGKTHLAGNTLA